MKTSVLGRLILHICPHITILFHVVCRFCTSSCRGATPLVGSVVTSLKSAGCSCWVWSTNPLPLRVPPRRRATPTCWMYVPEYRQWHHFSWVPASDPLQVTPSPAFHCTLTGTVMCSSSEAGSFHIHDYMQLLLRNICGFRLCKMFWLHFMVSGI